MTRRWKRPSCAARPTAIAPSSACAQPFRIRTTSLRITRSVISRASASREISAVRIALRTVAGDVLRARSACSRSALGVMPSADMSARTGAPIARRSRKLNRRPGALQVGAIPDGPRARPSPGPKPRKRHLCDCRPGWEAKARPGVRSSTHSSQRLVGATCQPLQRSRSSAESSSPRAGRRTTTIVQPGATTRPRRRSLRSRPRGCRRPRALRWQPSAGV